ncbi:ProQ/FINO family protein [Caballeronia fortuita]|uniref:ProQ/FINO family protein n=1 Tax=Caballeronia fortuita TaxID=1777138 RepID=UPI0009EEA688
MHLSGFPDWQLPKRKKAAPRRTSAPVGVERAIKRPPKRAPVLADAATRAVTTLQRDFPHGFPHSPAPKVSLKLGIRKDVLGRAASLALSERDARNGVKLWCRGAITGVARGKSGEARLARRAKDCEAST